MSPRFAPVLLLLALACSGGQSASGPAPAARGKATAPDAAVRNFMQAVADSNIAGMSQVWGTKNGPAAKTRQPADWEQRLGITQLFLRRTPYRITGIEEVRDLPDRRVVQVELTRTDVQGATCIKRLPVTVVETREYGWLVVGLDLTVAGTPGRACAPPAP